MNADTQQKLARERSVELAEQDVPVIDALLDSKGWAYLTRRLREKRDALRAALADDDSLSDADTRTLRRIVRIYDEILQLPTADRSVHLHTLAQAAQRSAGPRLG